MKLIESPNYITNSACDAISRLAGCQVALESRHDSSYRCISHDSEIVQGRCLACVKMATVALASTVHLSAVELLHSIGTEAPAVPATYIFDVADKTRESANRASHLRLWEVETA